MQSVHVLSAASKNPTAHRFARALAEETRREVFKPRIEREWIELAFDALGLVPGCRAVAEVAGLCVSLLARDFKALGWGLLHALPWELLPLGRGAMTALKVLRKARQIMATAHFGSRVVQRAAALA